MNPLHTELPLLVRHAGVWEGAYTHLDASWRPADRHLFRIAVEFPDAGPVHYRQTSHYWWPDGRHERRCFEAAWRADARRLAWDDGRIHGALVQLDEITLYLRFGFHAEAGSDVCEMIQLAPDGARRARTWHWFRAHRLWRITLVDERRVAPEAAAFAQLAGPPDDCYA